MQSFAAENDEDVILDLQIMKFSRGSMLPDPLV